MEPFKNIYNIQALEKIANAIYKLDNSFEKSKFIKNTKKDLDRLELKERVNLITQNLHLHLNGNYKENINLLTKTLSNDKDHLTKEWSNNDHHVEGLNGFYAWPIAHYIDLYGNKDITTSLKAIKEITKRFTGEFAIRSYINRNPARVYKELYKWTKDKNHHVRRLVSEGTRPLLPWAIRVQLTDNLLLENIKLLTILKDDSSQYVRRSVANHLNDISKIDRTLAISTCKKWSQKKGTCTKLIRHATRTLLKAGDKEALKLNGINPSAKIKITAAKIDKKKIQEGDCLTLSFTIKNERSASESLLINYIIHYLKKNGSYSEKVFNIKQTLIKGKDTKLVSKMIPFKKVTTRKHYSGDHYIEIQINGRRSDKKCFTLQV